MPFAAWHWPWLCKSRGGALVQSKAEPLPLCSSPPCIGSKNKGRFYFRMSLGELHSYELLSVWTLTAPGGELEVGRKPLSALRQDSVWRTLPVGLLELPA